MQATKAQIAYLRNARAVMDAGSKYGNYFALWGPGPQGTGDACLRRGWINRVVHMPCYYLTDAGCEVIDKEGGA